MKRVFLWIMTGLLAGCDQRQPVLSDATLRQIRADFPGMTDACLNKIQWGGIEAMPGATDECFRMTPAQRWRGLWVTDLELSQFCPAPARECSYETPGLNIWLSGEPKMPATDWPRGQVYAVDFIGRKTVDRGPSGHMGMWDHEIIVDRMISIRQLPDEGTGEAKQ